MPQQQRRQKPRTRQSRSKSMPGPCTAFASYRQHVPVGDGDPGAPKPIRGPYRELIGRFPRFLPIFQTFLGDFNLQKLPSRRLQTLWEWKNRVLLEEYSIFNVVIPLEVE